MPTLGQELKQCREEKKITLDEISNATHISVRFLQAIERDDYKELPGDLYNRSFVRALARSVGFDELRALQSYERQSGAARVPTDEESVAAPADALKTRLGIGRGGDRLDRGRRVVRAEASVRSAVKNAITARRRRRDRW